MVSWVKAGHNARRRSGAPSSYTEAAGASMNRDHITSDEAHSLAQQADSARVPMGMDGYAACGMCGSSPCACPSGSSDELGQEQFSGTMMPRNNVQAGDPTYPGSKVNRQNIERIGATYRVTAEYGQVIDPTVGPTQANGRIVPSVAGRQNPNFQSGEEYSYI